MMFDALNFTGLEDPPPHPKSIAFRWWMLARFNYYIALCDVAREVNYYFDFDEGDDDTGDGTQEAPFKTVAKANTLRAASEASMGLFFKRGTTDDTGSTLTDDGKATTIGAWGTELQQAKPVIDGGGADATGILISGHTSCVKDIRSTNWLGAFHYPIMLTHTDGDVGLVLNCDADTSTLHCIGMLGADDGIGVVVGCTAHTLSEASGTFINGHSTNGGHTFLVSDNFVTLGGVGQMAVYGHTNTGTVALAICNNLTVSASSTGGNPFSFGNVPAAATDADARVFEIGTLQHEFAGGICQHFPVTGIVRINCRNNCKPAATPGYMTCGSGWAYNCLTVVNCTSISTGFIGLYYVVVSGALTWKGEHNHIHFKNLPVNTGSGIDVGEYENQAGAAGSSLINSIFSADMSKSGTGVHRPWANNVTSDGNAFYGIENNTGTSPENFYQEGTNRIDLNGMPQPGQNPSPASQLYRTGQPPPDGVFLEYDIDWNQRAGSTPNVGPVETGIAPTLGPLTVSPEGDTIYFRR